MVSETISSRRLVGFSSPVVQLAGLASFSGVMDVGEGTVNEDGGWQAQTSYQGVKTGYAYFKWLLEDDPDAAGHGVAFFDHDYSLGGWGVASGGNVVAAVDGDVNVTDNISVAEGGFLAVIASGDINIDPAVTNVEGVYVADGVIDTGASANRLLAKGVFTSWGGINFRQDSSTDGYKNIKRSEH